MLSMSAPADSGALAYKCNYCHVDTAPNAEGHNTHRNFGEAKQTQPHQEMDRGFRSTQTARPFAL